MCSFRISANKTPHRTFERAKFSCWCSQYKKILSQRFSSCGNSHTIRGRSELPLLHCTHVILTNPPERQLLLELLHAHVLRPMQAACNHNYILCTLSLCLIHPWLEDHHTLRRDLRFLVDMQMMLSNGLLELWALSPYDTWRMSR